MSACYQRLVQAAAELFADRGYRRTAVDEIARQAGVSTGTLYRYVRDKAGLFYVALRLALVGDDTLPARVPIPTPGLADLLRLVPEALDSVEEESPVPALTRALAARSGCFDPESIGAELHDILMGIFVMSHTHALAARMIEGATEEWPRLANRFHRVFGHNVAADLARYLRTRSRRRLLKAHAEPGLTAYLVVDIMARAAERHVPCSSDGQLADTITALLAEGLL